MSVVPKELATPTPPLDVDCANMTNVLQKVATPSKNEQRSKTTATFLFSLAVLLLLVAAGLIASMWWIVDSAKESHVKEGIITDLKGAPVAVESIESYADLFDLPSFDMHTLNRVTKLTLDLPGNQEVTLSISGALKRHADDRNETRQSRMVTFLTNSGNDVVVDEGLRLALVKLQGASYIVKPRPRPARTLKVDRQQAARLYSASEFFGVANTFLGGGKRGAYTQISNFASVQMTAASSSSSSDSCSDPCSRRSAVSSTSNQVDPAKTGLDPAQWSNDHDDGEVRACASCVGGIVTVDSMTNFACGQKGVCQAWIDCNCGSSRRLSSYAMTKSIQDRALPGTQRTPLVNQDRESRRVSADTLDRSLTDKCAR